MGLASDSAPEAPTVVLSLRSWLLMSYLAVFSLPVLVLLGTGALAWDLRQQTQWDLEHQGAVLSMLIGRELAHAREARAGAGLEEIADTTSALLNQVKGSTLAGIRVTDTSGVVVMSSALGAGEDLSQDPEVVLALQGQTTSAVRPRGPPSAAQPWDSPSRRARVRVFVTLPLRVDGEILGVIVLSRTPREELQALYQMAPQGLMLGTALALLLTLLVAVVSGLVLSRSLGRLDRGAMRIAQGSLQGREELAGPTTSHVAEVARLAVSVSTMARRLEERIGYISEFASNVSHEFKTPLATLRGTLELLGDAPDMEEAQRHRFLHNASKEVERLGRMVGGLLTLARAEEHAGRERLDLASLLQGWGRALEVPVRGQPEVVTANQAQLEAVCRNLVENARRHGGEGVTVVIEAWSTAHHTGFEVVDDGVGISAANLPRVFDRFFTTDRQGGGTGLGLALVRAIVQRHGGHLDLRSEPGCTRFRVSLPRADASR